MPSTEQLAWARSIDDEPPPWAEIAGALGRGGLDLHLGLLALGRRAEGATDAATLRGAAALLPRSLPADPSASRLLAQLYLRLWTWLEGPVLPDWRSIAGPAALRLAWLRTAALTEPAAIAGLAGEPLAQALDGLDVDELLRPAATLLALARAPGAEVQAIAGRLLGPALRRARVSPGEAHAVAAALAGSPAATLRRAAYELLAEPWAQALPLPHAALAAGLADEEPIARAGLAAAIARGLAAPVAAVVADDEAPPRLRQEALAGLATMAGAEVSVLLGAAMVDPILFAGPACAALAHLHRRGVFLRDHDLDDLLALYAADPRAQPALVARVAYTSRRALIERLRAGEPADLDLGRRLALLLAIDRATAAEDDLSLVTWLLDQLDARPDAQERAAILAALAASERAIDADDAVHAAIEARVLGHLDAHPAAALRALRVHGGAAARAALRARLGIDPPGAIDPAILGDHDDALALLWHLGAEDPEARAGLLAAIADEPRPLPPAIVADLGPILDPAEEAILARLALRSPADAAPRAVALVRTIDALARAERASLVPALTDAVIELSRVIGRGEPFVDDADARGEARERLPAAALQAIGRLGERLRRRERVRPALLCGVEGPAAARAAMQAAILCRALAAVDDDPRALAVVLRTLHAVRHPRIHAAVLPLRRRREPELRKLVIPLLARDGADDLASDLRALCAADDVESARQAIVALGELGAREHADALAGALEHPNMNLKKAAAEALARAGAPAVVPRLVFWLGHSDNPGLRGLLLAALAAIVGDAATATLLAALEREEHPRRRGLLIEALDRRLEVAAIRLAATRDAAWARELLARIATGEVAPAGGDAAALRAELDRRGLAGPEAQARGPIDPLLRAIARDGLTDDHAAALLGRAAAGPLDADDRRHLRPHLARWLELAARGPAQAAAIVRLVAAVIDGPPSAAEALHLARALPLLVGALERAEPARRGPLVDLLDRLLPLLGPGEALLVGHVLKDLSPAPNTRGRPPLAALRRAGLLLERADVERAVAGAANTADPAALERAILGEAFDVGGGDPRPLPGDAAAALCEALDAGDPAALDELRGRWQAPTRATVRALIDRFPGLAPPLRAAALGWLFALQPPDAPAWDRPPPPPPGRRPRPQEASQPPSAAQLADLLGRLAGDDEDARTRAARALAAWPDPAIRGRVLAAYLGGRLPLDALDDHLRDLPGLDAGRLAACDDLAALRRLARALPSTRPPLALLGPLVDRWRVEADPERQRALRQMIDRYDHRRVFVALQPALARGEWGALDLVRGLLPPRAVPEALIDRARLEGRADVVARLQGLCAGPSPADTAPPPAPLDRAAALARLADPRARLDDRVAAYKALARAPDPALVDLCRELVRGPELRLRLHAHRLLRRAAPRADSLEASRFLLSDPRADVRRRMIQTLAHARDAAALPAILALVDDPAFVVQRAVEAAVRLFGAAARAPLRAALRAARPDRRDALHALLALLDAADEG